MKALRLVLALAIAAAAAAGCNAQPAATQPAAAAPPAGLESLRLQISYAIGAEIGTSMKQDGVEVDVPTLARAMTDALAGAKLAMTPEQIDAAKLAFQKQMIQKMQETAQKNLKDGEAFLDKNKSANGYSATASGLQYKVVQEGKGAVPKMGETVTVNYRGTLTDGTEFDSSYKRGQPASFVVGEVIPGWNEGLQMMKVGAKYKLAIPAALAYGPRGQGGAIPPNAVLLFEVELLDVKPTPAAPDMQGMPGMPTH